MTREEGQRLGTQRGRLRALLLDREWHTNHEMSQVAGYRFGGRLQELEEEGFAYEKRHIDRSTWEYRLTRTPDDRPQMTPSGQCLLLEVA